MADKHKAAPPASVFRVERACGAVWIDARAIQAISRVVNDTDGCRTVIWLDGEHGWLACKEPPEVVLELWGKHMRSGIAEEGYARDLGQQHARG